MWNKDQQQTRQKKNRLNNLHKNGFYEPHNHSKGNSQKIDVEPAKLQAMRDAAKQVE